MSSNRKEVKKQKNEKIKKHIEEKTHEYMKLQKVKDQT
jgi:hypothetical protein